jgi:hypothetical protein
MIRDSEQLSDHHKDVKKLVTGGEGEFVENIYRILRINNKSQ